MRIIAIANQKGGCGKTTTAINLASALSRNGKRILLFDLDPQAHASLGLDVQSQDSIYNVISRLTPRKLGMENIIQRVEDSFDIIPSSILVGTLEQELADEIGRELKLSGAIEPLKERYDYILIDCPPSLGILTVNALRASQELIIPVEPSRFSLQGVDHVIDIVQLVKDRLNHPIDCRILVTMFDARLRHSFAMLETFKQRFGPLLLDTIIHVNVQLKESAVLGKTVSLYAKYCRGSKDYYSLAKEVIFLEEKKEKEPLALETVPEDFSQRMRELIAQETKAFLPVVKFIYNAADAQDAKAVFITGSFNDWALDENCRLKKIDGRWEADIPLKPGLYKYQFIVDGVWKEDPNNPQKERNSFGDVNSLIEVKDA